MNLAFYLASVVAIAATAAVICGRNAIHALLYLIVSLLAIAVVFVTFGAPFVAALEVIVYAGAIMVLFVFVIVLLNVTPETLKRESAWLRPANWLGPAVLSVVLLVGLAFAIGGHRTALAGQPIGPQAVGVSLFSAYLLGVELASLLLLAGLIGAYHLGHRSSPEEEKRERVTIGDDAGGNIVPTEASPHEGGAVAGDVTLRGQEVRV